MADEHFSSSVQKFFNLNIEDLKDDKTNQTLLNMVASSHHFVCVQKSLGNYVWDKEEPDPKYLGVSIATHNRDGTVLLSAKVHQGYMYMKDDKTGHVMASDGKNPGPEGHCNFIKTDTKGIYRFRTAKWPELYAYMQVQPITMLWCRQLSLLTTVFLSSKKLTLKLCIYLLLH